MAALAQAKPLACRAPEALRTAPAAHPGSQGWHIAAGGAAAPLTQRQRQRQQRQRAAPVRAGAAEPRTTAAAAAATPTEVRAVLFDMDGVLCESEGISRLAAVEAFAELYGVTVQPDDFLPFTGRGENNFLGGVARQYNVADFDIDRCKAAFFEIYFSRYCKPGSGISHKGARQLVEACRAAGLKTAVASSADRVKVDAQLMASDIPQSLFDAVVSADAFENLKPSPDIFLAAAAQLGVPPANCVVIEDAVAGVQAARAAGMRVIGVTTSLAPEAMQGAAPDEIQPGIGSITVADIQGLRLRPDLAPQQAQQAAPAQAAPREQQGATAPAASSTSGQGGSSQGGQAWLNGWVDLPGGYKTTRRDLLKFGSLGGAFGSLYIGATRLQREPAVRRWLLQYHVPTLIQLAIIAYVARGWQFFGKSLSYASPRALLNAVLPQAALPEAGAEGGRVAAFKRFIADLEKRGGGQAVPEFPAGLDWLNVPGPLRLGRELRGKVVVLDFWTYCCINCMHILPDLAAIEAKFEGRPFAVVGVHSAKFDNEKDTEAIRSAVLRYEVTHPVVNDGGMTLWRDLGVSSWPTLAVVSPAGRVITMLAGEGHRQDIDDIVTAALEYYGETGQLVDTPVPQALERDKDPRLAASPLRFPGKVASDLAGGRLFISDSSNNRLVITDLQGRFMDQVGCGAAGLLDGDFASAAFHRPQGLAYSAKRNCLYVADTEAHALREVDLSARSVRTLAGTGRKGADYSGGAAGAAQALNSPWDVALDSTESAVYVAMAGQHQVWRYDVATGVAANFSGSGYERNQNGVSGLTSAWAQPSGLSLAPDGASLFVADSESSTVRRLDLRSGGATALVGGDPLFSDNLFRFGDKDGSGNDALLQHPLAVLAAPDGTVYVADSYNHRLKALDPSTASLRTLAGAGTAGYKDGAGTAGQLSEPGGLALGPDGTIIIADTNNSLIRQYDPRTQRLTTLALTGVLPPRRSPDGPPAGGAAAAEPPPGAALVQAATPVVAAAGEVRLSIRLPPGYHLTPGANSRFEAVAIDAAGLQLTPAAGALSEAGGAAVAAVRFSRPAGSAGGGLARMLAKVYFCQDGSECLFQEVCFDVPLAAVQAGAPGVQLLLEYRLSASAPVVALPGL